MRYVNVEVDGHAPQVESLPSEEDGSSVPERWRATCTCGSVGELRDNLGEALTDRFAHEDEIGMRVAADEERLP